DSQDIGVRVGSIELNYTKGQKTAWVFDLCTVIKCGSREQDWKRYDVYLCVTGNQPKKGPLCGTWAQVWWNSRPGGWTYTPDRTSRWYEDYRALKTKIDITRTPHGVGKGVNPIMLTADENPAEYFVLGVEQPGTDTMGLIKVNFLDPIPNVATTTAPSKTEEQTEVVSTEVVKINLDKLTGKDMIKLSTGYAEKNMWLDWVTSTAGEKGLSDCLVGASARPTLILTPAPLYPRTDPQGFRCMLAMHMTPIPSNCSSLVSLFPVVKNTTVPPVFTPREGNYTCLHRKKTGYIKAPVMMGNVSSDWCSLTVDVTSWANMSTLVWARADLFWYCGGTILYNFLPPQWIGTCTMTRLAVPLNMIGRKLKAQMTARIKRNTADFDWMSSSPTYIDAIGVPRGVPNEFKLANQIAAGFESSLCWWCTTNKNVDRINYVYYNVQRLGNATGDAINRMALDMLLAEKGGVCHMFGEQCCTVIPNNTAPDGSVTRALQAIRALNDEMASHIGIDNAFTDIFDSWFGKWRNLVISVVSSLIVVTGMLILCGCCCVPCIRSLCPRPHLHTRCPSWGERWM
uniref:Envelope protein n=1 Tax=Seriola lalandi dorsalis TaxID=1841481 RepID=A0A3B4XVT2_SERLL